MADDEEAARLITGEITADAVPLITFSHLSIIITLAFITSSAIVGILYGGPGLQILVVSMQSARVTEKGIC